MIRLPRLTTLLVSTFLLGACAQLIGLSDYEKVNDADAGEDGNGGRGSGGKGGSAGAANAGGAGNASGNGGGGGRAGSEAAAGGDAGSGVSGEGGEAGEGGGEGGEGGVEAGSAGQSAGDAGTPGSGGSSAGTGGSAGSGGSGGLPCIEITGLNYSSGAIDQTDPKFLTARYDYATSPNVGSAGQSSLSFQFYQATDVNGAATGTFELGTGIDSNYSTCARCLRGSSDSGTKDYFATSGAMVIDSTSRQMDGVVDLSISDVTLVEVTIDDKTFVSEPVLGGRCLHIAAADVRANVGWTCNQEYYWDAACECGCGVPDPVCASPYPAACDNCGDVGSCSTASCLELNFLDNSVCTEDNIAWGGRCEAVWYGDGECDCGCGSVDVDCPSANASDCLWCFCRTTTDSCTPPNGVVPTDNGLCE
jgi:hypothetical protein